MDSPHFNSLGKTWNGQSFLLFLFLAVICISRPVFFSHFNKQCIYCNTHTLMCCSMLQMPFVYYFSLCCFVFFSFCDLFISICVKASRSKQKVPAGNFWREKWAGSSEAVSLLMLCQRRWSVACFLLRWVLHVGKDVMFKLMLGLLSVA